MAHKATGLRRIIEEPPFAPVPGDTVLARNREEACLGATAMHADVPDHGGSRGPRDLPVDGVVKEARGAQHDVIPMGLDRCDDRIHTARLGLAAFDRRKFEDAFERDQQFGIAPVAHEEGPESARANDDALSQFARHLGQDVSRFVDADRRRPLSRS